MSFSANIDDLVAENRNGLLGKKESWSRVRLKEIATILNGFPFESAKFKKESGTPLIRIRDILPGRTETFYDGDFDPDFLVQRGEILIGMDGDFNCKEWTGEPALLNQRVCKITPDTNLFSKQFLKYVLPGYLSAINAETSSVTVKHLSSRTIGDIPLPLPPLDEQRAIVAEIEKQFTRLEAGVGALKRVQASLKRYRAAVLKAACEGKLVLTEAELAKRKPETGKLKPEYETGEQLLQRILNERRKNWTGRGKYKQPVAPDTTDLPELPEGWTWATLDQLLTLMRNGISAKPDAEVGLPILRISAVRALSVNLEEARYLNAKATDYPDYILDQGDILFTRYNGNPELVGVCGVVPLLTSPLAHPDKLIRCKLFPAGALADFVAIMANVGVSRNYLAKRVRTTAGQAGISGADLKGLPIPLAPSTEQKRIVEEVERRLSVIEELEATVSTNLQRATRLRQSILQKAFSAKA